MPEQARVVRLEDGLEVFVLEGNDGVKLHTYRRTLRALPRLWKIDVWPTAPSDEIRNRKFVTVDDLVTALRLKLSL